MTIKNQVSDHPENLSRVWRRAAIRAWPMASLLALGLLSGCGELVNPMAVTYATADPARLIVGSVAAWAEGTRTTITYEHAASDESVFIGNSDLYRTLHETGDLAAQSFYQGRVALMSESRELTRFAISRAKELNQPAQLRRAQAYRGWYLIGTAYRWGDQPIEPGGKKLTQREIYEVAREHFEAARVLPDNLESDSLILVARRDSSRLRAHAGVAWVQLTLGRDPVDAERLQAAIKAAEEVLSANPRFFFILGPDINSVRSNITGRQLQPSPPFKKIPFWWDDTSQPQGNKFIDWNGLHLIIAESKLLLGDLAGAKAALKATPLLKVNHVDLGRERVFGDPPLTDAEVDALIDPLDAAGLAFVISELRRENEYAQGWRNVGPKGPLFPVELPPTAY